MTALALFEAKKVLRAPLLWLGAALLGAFAWLNAREYLPLVAEDAGFVFQGVVVVAAFSLLAGGWVGLRDGTSGAAALVGSTPLRQRGLVVPARMAALAASGTLVYLTVVAAAAATSYARGGRGWPDPFLVLDGGLYVGLCACTGFAIGYLTGSRIMSLLAAPLLPGSVYYLQGRMSGRVTDPSWLLPNPRLPERFGPLGYQPDVLPLHSAYLAGILIGLTGVVWLVTSRRDRTGSVRGAVAASLAGTVLFVACGAWLSLQPVEVEVFGSDRSQWVEITSFDDHRRAARASRDPGAYPDDGLATECAVERGIEVCVFPENDAELVRALAEDASALAPFTALEGVPDRFRMVPASESSYVEGCRGGDEYLIGSRHWTKSFFDYDSLARNAFYCVVFGPRMIASRVGDVLIAWFDTRVVEGREGAAYTRRLRRHTRGEEKLAVLRALGALRVSQVVDRLGPLWREVRRRELTLTELDRAMRR